MGKRVKFVITFEGNLNDDAFDKDMTNDQKLLFEINAIQDEVEHSELLRIWGDIENQEGGPNLKVSGFILDESKPGVLYWRDVNIKKSTPVLMGP